MQYGLARTWKLRDVIGVYITIKLADFLPLATDPGS